MTIWERLDELLDEATCLIGAASHGLAPLLARRYTECGLQAPAPIRDEAIRARQAELAANVLLRRIRDVLSGPVLVIKGPELSAHYPARGLRSFRDLDLVVPDAVAAQADLIDAGFLPAGSSEETRRDHHQPPLVWPGLPLGIELHSTVPGPYWMRPVSFDRLYQASEPSRTGVAGLRALRPGPHAVVVAGHAWRHVPFRRLLDVVDVAALIDGSATDEADTFADEAGVLRVWSTARHVADVIVGASQPHRLDRLLWCDRLTSLRQRGERKERAARWLGPLWADRPLDAGRGFAALIDRDAAPLAKRNAARLAQLPARLRQAGGPH